MTPRPITSSITGIATLIKRITEVLRRREPEPHPTPLPLHVATLPPNIIQKMVKAILINGHEVVGSSLIKNKPLDIDVHVPGLRFKVVDVLKKLTESFSHIEYGARRTQSTIEHTNILYGDNIDCRFIVVITFYLENGDEKEITIDLTDGMFNPPVYFTNTVKAEKMQVVFNKKPSAFTNWKFDFVSLSKQAQKNTFTTVLVPDYDGARPITTLERVMEMQREDRSEVNPQSVLFGYDIVASLDAIRRINDTNNKKKFIGGVDYRQTVEITITNKNLCEPKWCSCNQGAGHIYQHGSKERTFVTLQCCNTTVCADLLNTLKATHKAQFCPFSGPDGHHFMQFMHNSLLKPRDYILMTRLNRHWESTMWQRNHYPNVGPHGDECTCPWSELNLYDDYDVPPLFTYDFEDDSSDEEMPEIAGEDEAKDPSHIEHTTLECLGSPKPDENNVFVPVPIAYDRTMKPHCSTPGCEQCLYKMKCYQTWASSLIVTHEYPQYSFAMMLPDHMALNL